MNIHLSEWNEYIADDVHPGPPPAYVALEFMQIVTTVGVYETGAAGKWTSLADPTVRMFWRIKK